jgi:hypothetical protein
MERFEDIASMSEQQWLACADPGAMLESILPRASSRKLILFATECCRRHWSWLEDQRHREVVEAAERLADGLATDSEFDEAMQPIVDLWAKLPPAEVWHASQFATAAVRHLGTPGGAFFAANYLARGLRDLAATRAEETVQCGMIRDLIGQPFQPICFSSAWLAHDAPRAIQLARSIYDERRFGDVPLLAEVLEESGCNVKVAIEHCKGPDPHFRGCWVVDALLQKEPAVRVGLVTHADWQACTDAEPLLQFLWDKGETQSWRRFALACCRRIDHLITDSRSRRALEVAERHVDGIATDEELAQAAIVAQKAVDEARHTDYEAEANANFCLTPPYCAVGSQLFAAIAARGAVCSDPRNTDAAPDTFEANFWQPSHTAAVAALEFDVLANVSGADEAKRVEKRVRAKELSNQCASLRELFAAYLGPPGEESAWLRCGFNVQSCRPAEQWCRLPTRCDLPRN